MSVPAVTQSRAEFDSVSQRLPPDGWHLRYECVGAEPPEPVQVADAACLAERSESVPAAGSDTFRGLRRRFRRVSVQCNVIRTGAAGLRAIALRLPCRPVSRKKPGISQSAQDGVVHMAVRLYRMPQ